MGKGSDAKPNHEQNKQRRETDKTQLKQRAAVNMGKGKADEQPNHEQAMSVNGNQPGPSGRHGGKEKGVGERVETR
jgi:hypothetical protein